MISAEISLITVSFLLAALVPQSPTPATDCLTIALERLGSGHDPK